MTHELEHLRNFATAARRGGFNVPFFRQDGNTGEYRRSGKNNPTVMNGQKLACDPADAMTGWQKFEKKVPVYQIGRVADGYQSPPRSELGDLDEGQWENNKDPWVRIDLVPFWDVESREALLFSAASQGSRDAVANLIDVYVNNIAVHPDDLDKVPLIELASDSYTNNHGRRIFFPVFEILDWIERPAAVRRISATAGEDVAIDCSADCGASAITQRHDPSKNRRERAGSGEAQAEEVGGGRARA